MNNTLIKLAVFLLAIKEIWLLLGVPAFANAVIDFLTVGAVPGTNQTLSPDQIYKLLAGAFVLIGGLVFRKELMRLIHRSKRDKVHGVDSTAERSGIPIPHPLASITAALPEPARSGRMQIWTWRLKGVALLIRIQIMQLAAVGRVTAMRFAGVVALRVVIACKYIAKASMAAAKFTATEAVTFWLMIEPYLRRFDRWLEKKLHEYDRTSALLSLGNEMTSTMRKWREDYKALLRESGPRK